MRTPSLLVFFTVLLLSARAHATSYVWWETPLAACVPGDPAIQSDRYAVVAGSVSNKGTNLDLITLYCPVPRSNDFNNPYILSLTAEDTDGHSGDSNVVVQ